MRALQIENMVDAMSVLTSDEPVSLELQREAIGVLGARMSRGDLFAYGALRRYSEDAVQELMMRWLEKPSRLAGMRARTTAKIEAFLRTCIRRMSLRLFKRRRREVLGAFEEGWEPQDQSTPWHQGREDLEQLYKEICALAEQLVNRAAPRADKRANLLEAVELGWQHLIALEHAPQSAQRLKQMSRARHFFNDQLAQLGARDDLSLSPEVLRFFELL